MPRQQVNGPDLHQRSALVGFQRRLVMWNDDDPKAETPIKMELVCLCIGLFWVYAWSVESWVQNKYSELTNFQHLFYSS